MTSKLAISLPDELVEAVRLAVGEGRASSVSAYIAGALAERIQNDSLAELLAAMAADAGPPDQSDRQWARSALGLE